MREVYYRTTAVKFMLLGCTVLVIAACSGPVWQFPGGGLVGEEEPLDLTKLSPDGGLFQLETNPQEPYSVNLGYVVIDGNMYIDPAESRSWYQNIKSNPQIRIRLEGATSVNPAIAVTETKPSVLQQFAADRIVLKILPR